MRPLISIARTLLHRTLLLPGLWLGLAAPVLAGDPPPVIELQFRTPAVTVSPTDEVPIWVTMSVSEAPLTFDTTASEPPFGLGSLPLPALGNNFVSGLFGVPFASYNSLSLFIFRVCNDEVSTGCSPLIYEYTVPGDPAGWFAIEQPFELAAGSSRDFFLYSLRPVGGAAPAGSYDIFNLGLGLRVSGLAADGETSLEADVFVARTCDDSALGCAFTVTVVPEPHTAWLMLAGIVPLWMRLRRR